MGVTEVERTCGDATVGQARNDARDYPVADAIYRPCPPPADAL